MLQKLDKSGIKWCLSSNFSLPAKFRLIQTRIFTPIRAHRDCSITFYITLCKANWSNGMIQSCPTVIPWICVWCNFICGTFYIFLSYHRRQWKKQRWKTVQCYGRYHSVYLIPLKQFCLERSDPSKDAKIAFRGSSLSKCVWKTYSHSSSYLFIVANLTPTVSSVVQCIVFD